MVSFVIGVVVRSGERVRPGIITAPADGIRGAMVTRIAVASAP